MLALKGYAHGEVQHIKPIGIQEFLQGVVVGRKFALRAPAFTPHRLGIERSAQTVQFPRQWYDEHMRRVGRADRLL